MFCFFFEQKTAYDMRMSDWSSDVCSSDLRPSSPGMRTSVNSSCGGGRVASASSTAAAASKPTTSKPASLSAVASTKRTLRSSSTTQMVAFIVLGSSHCQGKGGSKRTATD